MSDLSDVIIEWIEQQATTEQLSGLLAKYEEEQGNRNLSPRDVEARQRLMAKIRAEIKRRGDTALALQQH